MQILIKDINRFLSNLTGKENMVKGNNSSIFVVVPKNVNSVNWGM